jgi:hypothetical protein
MPLQKEKFLIVRDDLQREVDVDDSRGRSCPINFNFVEEGYLSKDTGCSLFGDATVAKFHSLYHFKKKDGTSYILGVTGDRLKKYDTTTEDWIDVTSGTVTMTIATPAVVSQTAHGLKAGSKIVFSTTGALPTGVTAGTTYYVIATGLTADAFQFSATLGGSAVDTSGSQSGVHTITRLYTADAEFGYIVYDDNLYFGNAVENYTKFTGTAFTEYDTAPKGNILEVFEDRMHVAGVLAQPLSVYYSKIADPTDFTVSTSAGGVIQPLGTDFVTNLKAYYNQLLVFKTDSIWKVEYVYNQIEDIFIPKPQVQSGNYGACGRKAVCWVENDLWFFTGREVRSIGYRDQQLGVLGVNSSIISNQIKETLYNILSTNYSKVAVFYNNRRFYLSVPLNSNENDTVFVSHLLYKATWTKYENRIKASCNDFMAIDNVVYSTKSVADYGVLKWSDTLLNDNDEAIACEVFFKKVEEKEFNRFTMHRYLDLMFKDLQAKIKVTVKQDANDVRHTKDTEYFIGNSIENEEATIGEVSFGQMLYGDAFGEEISVSPFLKNRISYLLKAQSLTIGLSNSGLDETFTLSQFAMSGFKEVRKLFKKESIVSM